MPITQCHEPGTQVNPMPATSVLPGEDGSPKCDRQGPAVAVDQVDEGDTVHRHAGTPSRARTHGLSGVEADHRADSVAGDRPHADAGPGGAAGQERQAIARRLHRILVDYTYGVARDAWSEAVPELRATWENHKNRYPERVQPAPRTTPDGSWVAGDHRRLTPEQNAEAAKACADLADEGRRDILPALKRVESAEPGRRLAGLKHMLKGEDRLKEKIAERLTAKPGRTVQQILNGISDPVRFTFSYSPQRYAHGVLADVERLKAEGFELVKLKNLWTKEQYKGVNSQWRRPETGLRVEVQFHTAESLEAKELTHEAYERIRSSASPAELEALQAFQGRVNAFLVTPEGTEEIRDYPEKRDDRKDYLLCDR
jgi:hypothetical protein